MIIKKESESPPACQRRFDSLAILTQGNEVCSACCFDGSHLIFSNNLGLRTSFFNLVLIYLQAVTQKSREEADYTNFLKFTINLKNKLRGYAQNQVALMRTSKIYSTRFKTALNKVTRSVYLAYHEPNHPTAFSIEMTEAIRLGQIIFLKKDSKRSQKNLPHAELQIVDYIYANHANLLIEGQEVYVGVAKKCCGNCEDAILTINEFMGSRVIAVRGDGHGFNFGAGIPEFLKSNKDMETLFLARKNRDTLEQAFVTDAGIISGEDQLLTPSSSVIDSSSAHESTQSAEDDDINLSKQHKLSTTATLIKIMQPTPLPLLPPVPRTPEKPKPQPRPKSKPTTNVSSNSKPKLKQNASAGSESNVNNNKAIAQANGTNKSKAALKKGSLSAPALLFNKNSKNKLSVKAAPKKSSKTKPKAAVSRN